jgi:hypothetical protein
MTDSPPPPLSTYVPTVPRAVEGWPCPHNAWDNLRMRKGIMMLRCRTCGESWKVFRPEPCDAFFKVQRCDKGEDCPHPHIFKTRHSGVRKDTPTGLPGASVAPIILHVVAQQHPQQPPTTQRPSQPQQPLRNRSAGNPPGQGLQILPPCALTPVEEGLQLPSSGSSFAGSPKEKPNADSTHAGSPKYSHNPYNAEVLSPTTLVMKGSQNIDFFSSPTTKVCDKCHSTLPAHLQACMHCGHTAQRMGPSALQMPTSPLINSVFQQALPPPSPPMVGINMRQPPNASMPSFGGLGYPVRGGTQQPAQPTQPTQFH